MMIRKVGKVISATCFNDIDLETYRNRDINISSPETGCLIKSNIQYFIKIYLYILIWDVKGFPLKNFFIQSLSVMQRYDRFVTNNMMFKLWLLLEKIAIKCVPESYQVKC